MGKEDDGESGCRISADVRHVGRVSFYVDSCLFFLSVLSLRFCKTIAILFLNMLSHQAGADILPGTEVMRDRGTGNATRGTV